MSTTDLTQCPAHELLQMYRSGQTSPVEVTQAVLARIERLNPKINAFCLVDAPSALVDYTIQANITSTPAAELMDELERQGAVGLVARLRALRETGVIE